MKHAKHLTLTVLMLLYGVINHAQVLRYVNWGYCDNTVATGIGTDYESVVSGAIYIPPKISEMYKGKNITAIRIGLRNNVSNLTIFATKDLNTVPIVSTDLGEKQSGTASYSFSTAYIPDGEGFYIGYTCTGVNAIGCSNVYNACGCWIKKEEAPWQDYASDDYGYNSLNISAHFEGYDFPVDARLINAENLNVKTGDTFMLTGKIENLSTKTIKNYQLKYRIDEEDEQTLNINTYLAANSTEKFSIDFKGYSTKGRHTVKIRLTEINGAPDEYEDNNNIESKINVKDFFFKRRMVVEEGTATWCGYCPRGIVGFREMSEKYPDTFIGIAVHYKDEMKENTYAPLHAYFSGYPSCIVNRYPSMIFDPSTDMLEKAYAKFNSEYAIVDIKVTAHIDENDPDLIQVESTTQFSSDEQNVNYKIAFVVVENGITGYSQANNYSGSSTPIGGFETLPGIAEITFDHVARGIYDYEGISGSLPSTVVEEELYNYNKALTIPDVQNKDNLSIVALLINGNTGVIMNAGKNKITSKTSGINELVNETEVSIIIENGTISHTGPDGKLEIFSTTGASVINSGLQHGMYIVKYTPLSGGNSVIKKIIL